MVNIDLIELPHWCVLLYLICATLTDCVRNASTRILGERVVVLAFVVKKYFVIYFNCFFFILLKNKSINNFFLTAIYSIKCPNELGPKSDGFYAK